MLQFLALGALEGGALAAVRSVVTRFAADEVKSMISGYVTNQLTEEEDMARLPVPRSPAARKTLPPKPRSTTAEKLTAAGSVATGAATSVWGVDAILDYAKQNFPDAYNTIASVFSDQDIDVNDPDFRAAGDSARAHVVAELARAGLPESFGNLIGLSKAEALGYARLVREAQKTLVSGVDQSSLARQSTGDDGLDQAVTNLEIAGVCELLGLTGRLRARNLYRVRALFSTLREADVELFERHEQLFGPVRVNR